MVQTPASKSSLSLPVNEHFDLIDPEAMGRRCLLLCDPAHLPPGSPLLRTRGATHVIERQYLVPVYRCLLRMQSFQVIGERRGVDDAAGQFGKYLGHGLGIIGMESKDARTFSVGDLPVVAGESSLS